MKKYNGLLLPASVGFRLEMESLEGRDEGEYVLTEGIADQMVREVEDIQAGRITRLDMERAGIPSHIIESLMRYAPKPQWGIQDDR